MTYAALVKYGAWALFVLAITATIWFGVSRIHDNGRAVERSIWVEKVAKIKSDQASKDKEIAEELGRAMEVVAKDKEEQLMHLMELKDERDKQYKTLEQRYAADIRDVRVRNNTKATSDKRSLSVSSDPGKVSCAAEGKRLSREDEEDLIALAYEAQRDSLDFNILAARCSKNAVLVGD